MRERKSDIYAKELVENFERNNDIIMLVEKAMQTASWMGRFGGTNRFKFQNALKRELRNLIEAQTDSLDLGRCVKI